MITVSEQIIKLALAIVLSAFIGIEREISNKPAGLRTHVLVGLGVTIATLVSTVYFQMDPARVAAAIFTGIGFIGAGAIIASRDQVHGLTTAASIWVTAAVGLCIGTGLYVLAVISSILIVIVLFSGKIEKKAKKRSK